jgi:hypothetical protein
MQGQNLTTAVAVTAATVVIAVAGIAAYLWKNDGSANCGIGSLRTIGGSKPVIWWHVDDSQSNTKEWVSFEDRATHVPNEPYLALCMRKARTLWSSEFEVVPVIGRAAALQRLKEAGCPIPAGADRCPPALWMAWCRCAFLAHKGGLWLDGSVIPMGTAAEMRRRLGRSAVLAFGADADEELAGAEQDGSAGGPAAGRSAGWAASPGHPMWVGLSKDVGAVVAEGDASWSSFEARRSLRFLWDKHCGGRVAVDRVAEVSRDRYGKRLQYEDLFATKEWVNGTTEGGLWVPLPDGRDKLERTSAWLWFTRLSEAQIAEGNFLWARWATRA